MQADERQSNDGVEDNFVADAATAFWLQEMDDRAKRQLDKV